MNLKKLMIMIANSHQEISCDNYLTIEALEDDLTVSFSLNPLQYSIDDCKTWIELPVGTTTPAINAGEKISFKATGLTPTSDAGIGTFTVNKQFNLSGNCMSMLFGDNGKDSYDLTGYDYAFYKLFQNNSTLQYVSEKFLPATALSPYCYRNMFIRCTSLTTAPELPATTLVTGCYYSMFPYCTGLTIAPELPATELADSCYRAMFYSCTGLTIAPELPAITLTNDCYQSMFYGCSNLNYIKAMFTTTPSSSYTNNWVSGVASTGTFVKNIDATWELLGSTGIPGGWTIETASA